MSARDRRRKADLLRTPLDRRALLGDGAAAAAALAGAGALRGGSALAQDGSALTGVDPAKWTPEYIESIAGTQTVDTAAEVHAVVPPATGGDIEYWNAGPTQASPQIDRDIYAQFFEAWPGLYPEIPLVDGENNRNTDYGVIFDDLRVGIEGQSAPSVVKLPILGGVEFAAKQQVTPITLEEFGFTAEQFWPGALKSVTWEGQLYGVPTNNETMAFIYNKKMFADAGLDPEKPPATWADVAAYSKQIKDNLGVNGYGLVAKENHGNTPFRFMPVLWAHGSGALDEAEPNPTYRTVMINNEGGVAALQLLHDMYVRDRSVPTGALTNTQTENQDLFITGQIGMVISHPSEFVAMQGKAAEATGSDKDRADEIVANMAYALMPEGPVRRAVVFGGSNIHILTDEAHGTPVDREAAKALITTLCGPEWSTKFAWTGSNPGNLRGFATPWMKERLEQIRFLNVTTSMLPFGIPFPVIPESTEIMNIIVPRMIQNVLTEAMSPQESADDAAAQIKELLQIV